MTHSSPPGAVRAGIVGASGYTGVELLRLLAGHPVLEVVTVTADSNAGVAVVLNSGNANAATGDAGRADALRMCELAADGLGVAPSDVLVCSTGLIGIPMPMAPVESGIPLLCSEIAPGPDAGHRAARALMTTDTLRKESTADADLGDGRHIKVGGMAKGAAMLAPSMATMLAVLTTDAVVGPDDLHTALERAVQESFNALIIDACTSTNDTVLVLANGAAGGSPIGSSGHAYHALVEAVTAVCDDLARQMAADAEGATKLVHLVVRGARSSDEARRAARGVASSQLVQCSLYGSDPYWGRVLSELGASGAFIDPERVDIAYNGVTVCRHGIAALHDETALQASMAERNIEIVCDLNVGRSEATMRFTDLTHAYVDENMGTS